MRLCLGLGCLLVGLGWSQPEPPLRYQLTVDGKSHTLLLDRPLELNIGGRPVKLKLQAANYREFAIAGVRFHYPCQMSYEVDKSTPGLTIYTLDGNDAVIMLMCPGQILGKDELLKETVANLKAEYGKGKVVEEPLELKLNGSLLRGSRLRIQLLGQSLIQDCLGFRHQGRSYLLILQDSPRGGKPSPEGANVVKLLQRSFRLE